MISECMETEPFEIPTLDARTHLSGQIDFPIGRADRLPLVVMASGTGLFDRHVLFGQTGTARDFLFDDIAQGLLDAGLAVLRYDSRGVRCNLRAPRLAAATSAAEQEARCIDNDVRCMVTPATQRDDLIAVRQYAAAHRRVDSAAIILLGHSEGSMNVARAVQAAPGAQNALLLMTPVLESPAATYEWQVVQRIDTWMRRLRPDGAPITTEDVRAGFGNSPLSSLYSLSQFLPYDGPWTNDRLAELLDARSAAYAAEKAAVLAMPDDAPWPTPEPPVHASAAWWKQWFNDETPMATHYRDFSGPIICLFGTIDTQIDAARQQAAISEAGMDGRFEIHVLTGLGHALGIHGLYGPIAPDGRDALVRAALRLAAR